MEVDGRGTLQAFKALAQEGRLRMLALLAERERSVQELAQCLGVREPTASHHLALLRASDLVEVRKDGNTHWYKLNGTTLNRLGRALAGLDPSLSERAPADASAHHDRGATVDRAASLGAEEARTVQNYLTSAGRLKSFPASRKKRRAVLAWLADHFEPGRVYREWEVNEIIARFWDDRETFRRELVGHQMLARNAGTYWRRPVSDWVRT